MTLNGRGGGPLYGALINTTLGNISGCMRARLEATTEPKSSPTTAAAQCENECHDVTSKIGDSVWGQIVRIGYDGLGPTD